MTSLPAKPFPWPYPSKRGSLKHILVATDFSENATAALEWAVELAKTHGAQMTVVHSVRPEHPYEAMPESALMDNIATELESAVKLPKRWGVEAKGEAPPGKPWEIIPELARTMGVDLVVIGARGRSKLSDRLLGSTADRIIRSSSTPVLVVHEGGERQPQSIRTVLAAIDFSDESALALQAGLQVVRESREPVRIVLLHVAVIEGPLPGPRHVLPMPKEWKHVEKEISESLEAWAKALRTDRIQVEVKIMRGDPRTIIVEEAARAGAQLVTLGTVGRTGLGRFFMGSVAEYVLQHAACTVLTARKPDSP